ncbi:NrdH-like glutaredoxin [Mycobacterium phage SirPhilip]|uniref:NrdH-like glutaredoxin n=1 Tax=Mycobacterium phage SirPhilip TaxID=2015824 RepID=A0A222ZLC8_9CAUD|nr:NrdH-like glutaredoxin [Mycobacterium phage SirPhilip]ASR85268.1 NrdH-like glutaredoxin [Mycobacterium phage SirPhilip]
MITVYTTGPACYKCKLTKDALSKAGVAFTEVRLDQDEAAAAAMRDAGHVIAPVVVDKLTGATWSDFRRDLIKAAIEARA